MGYEYDRAIPNIIDVVRPMSKPTRFWVWYNGKYMAEYKSVRACLNFIQRKKLHIDYNGHPNRYGHHWSVSGFSDEMDRIMLEELGDSYKSYAAREDMMKDLEKIVARKIPVHYNYINGKYIPIKYELA